MRDSKLILILLSALVFFTAGFVLNLLEAILIPFVVSVFLSQLFAPLMAALRRRRVPALLAILLVLIVVSAVLLLAAMILASSAEAFTEAMPGYQAKLTRLLDGFFARVSASFPWIRHQIERWRWEEAIELSAVTGFVAAGLGSFLVFFTDLVLILLFLVFLLSGNEKFPTKLGRALAWGMVLAVPITATLKIVCENVEALQPIAVLMSDTAAAEGPAAGKPPLTEPAVAPSEQRA